MYDIRFQNTSIGTTKFEFGDPPMGFVHGEFYPNNNYDPKQSYEELSVYTPANEKIHCDSVVIEDYNDEMKGLDIQVTARLSDYLEYDKHFIHHKQAYDEKYKNDDNYLTINNLTVNYGKGDVVNDLSFNLAQGDIGCLLGESGCGKTTALRALAGLEALKSGDISLDDNSLNNTPAAKRGIGMVFQDYALFTHLTVAENVGFGLGKTSSADKNKRVADMLVLVGLTGYENSLPEQLSGGQQQRVALARALAPSPKLLLLDEPFSNLDINLRESLATSVRDILKATNTTAILVTHDQFEAFAMADKVGVMQQGKLAQWGTPEDLYHEPATPEIAGFIGEGVMLKGVVSVTSESNKVVKTGLGDLTLDEHTFPINASVNVLVRPDDIIHDDDSPYTAEVVKRVFRGANYLYTLKLDSGEAILSLIPSHHNHAIGERIGIVPMLDHVVAFAV